MLILQPLRAVRPEQPSGVAASKLKRLPIDTCMTTVQTEQRPAIETDPA